MADHPADHSADLSLDVPVVDDPSGLTPAWLTHALRSAGHDATVHAVTVEPVGTGQMGSSFRLTLDVTEHSPTPSGPIPRTLVAKLPTSDVEARVAIASSHRTEVTFYRDVASTIAARTPQCHLALVSEDATCFTLLLEDLAPAAQGDQLAGCTTEQLVTATHNLAGLHGPRWCDPDIVGLRGPLDAADPDTAAFLGEVLAGAVAPFAERLGDAVSPADVALLHDCAAAMPHFLIGRPERFSLMHGDYRLDNLMFHPDGTVAAVDWQTLGVGLAGRDLAYLIATSLEPDARREAEHAAIAGYHDRLAELTAGTGRGPVDAATTFDDYRYGLLQGPLIIVLGAAFGSSTTRGDAMFATMTARVCAAIRDHNTLSLIN